MGKKDKKRGGGPENEVGMTNKNPTSSISKRGWKFVKGGLGTAFLGYVLLSFTDPQGQNFASFVSPFLILGGYAVIAYGIIAPDPSDLPPSR